jgi:hypothetical protein
MADLLRSPNSSRGNPDARDDTHAAPASSSSPSLVRHTVTWLSVGFGPVLAIITYYPLIRAVLQQQPWIYKIFSQHYDVIFGLPSAALLSFMLVVVSEARFDNIEMEIVNLIKFRGASGPIILWVLCFLSIVLAIKLLW